MRSFELRVRGSWKKDLDQGALPLFAGWTDDLDLALVRLNDLAGKLWMQIDVEPTLPGHLKQWLFKPSKIRLGIWREKSPVPGSGFPAPRSMLAAGFFASPLLLHNEDVHALLTGGAVTRPQAYSIEVQAAERFFWRDSVRFWIYSMSPTSSH